MKQGGGYSIIMSAHRRGGVLSIKMCTYVSKGKGSHVNAYVQMFKFF